MIQRRHRIVTVWQTLMLDTIALLVHLHVHVHVLASVGGPNGSLTPEVAVKATKVPLGPTETT